MIGFLRKLLFFLLMFVLVVDIPIIVFSSFADNVILNSEFYKTEFEKVGLYSFAGEKLIEVAAGNMPIEGIEEILAGIVTDEWVRGQVDKNIDNFIGYARGAKDDFAPAIELAGVKAEMLVVYPEASVMLAELPDDYSLESGIELPENVRQVTGNVADIREISILVAIAAVLVSFVVYKDKAECFRKVGKRIARSGGVPFLSIALVYWKMPEIVGMVPDVLPRAAVGTIFSDALFELGWYTGIVLGVGVAMYVVGLLLRKVFEGKEISGET